MRNSFFAEKKFEGKGAQIDEIRELVLCLKKKNISCTKQANVFPFLLLFCRCTVATKTVASAQRIADSTRGGLMRIGPSYI